MTLVPVKSGMRYVLEVFNGEDKPIGYLAEDYIMVGTKREAWKFDAWEFAEEIAVEASGTLLEED